MIARGRAGKATKTKARVVRASRKTSAAQYPLLASAEVLRAIIGFSRAVTADIQDKELFQLLHRTLRDLLPKRLIAIRVVEPHSLAITDVFADDGLVKQARLQPAAPVKAMPPEGDDTSEAERGSPLLFERADAGFFVPLVAGGELTGEVHVNYRAHASAQRPYPIRADKALVIPLANQVAVVAHTRRLLRETEYLQHYLESLIDQANVLIVATNGEGRVTVWNRAMNRLTGFSRGQALGRDLLPWLTELGAPDIGRVLKQVAASGEPATREVRLPTVGGAILRAAFNVVTVRGQAGKTEAVLAIGQDVTALRLLQSQVIQAEKLATVGQIAAGVAHEINNPLTSIQVCTAALSRKAALAVSGKGPGALDIADLDRLKKIEEGAERIRRFARDLVSYARPSGSEVGDVQLNEVVEQALSFCEHVLHAAHAKVERDYGGNLPHIQAVRDQILQVVINLVTNAAHALEPRGGTIRVRTWAASGATVGLAVSDTGVGIKPDDRAKIFDPFFTTKPAGKGTGLGLSVVRNIVYTHGGQISFQSRSGSGTTFLVTLPVTPLGATVDPGGMPAI